MTSGRTSNGKGSSCRAFHEHFPPKPATSEIPSFPSSTFEHLGRPGHFLELRQKARAVHVGMLPARGTGTMLGEFGPKSAQKRKIL